MYGRRIVTFSFSRLVVSYYEIGFSLAIMAATGRKDMLNFAENNQ